MSDVFDFVIVGAGPAGLATAIAAKKKGLSAVVLEKAALVNTILHYPVNMVFFTTPELLEIGGLPFTTPYEKPTRQEALNYYRRVVDTYDLSIAFDRQVQSVTRASAADGPLVVEASDADGQVHQWQARAVVLATGAFDLPNVCGIPGEELPHVSHYYTEAHPYYRKDVVIVGGQNSAADAALDLYRSGARVTVVHRRAVLGDSIKYWVKPDIENRIKEGSIAARFEARVLRITDHHVTIERHGATEDLPADVVFLLTGYHSDTTLLKAAGVQFDPTTYEPRYSPDTLETNVPGVYLVGAVTTGRQSGRIFIENGRFHGERVAEVVAERLQRSAQGQPA